MQGDHTIEKAAEVSEKVLAAFFKVLQAQFDIFKEKYRQKDIYLQSIILTYSLLRNMYYKGHLISEWLFSVFNFLKNNEKIWWISALESKKWLNQKDKGTLLYDK